MMRMLRECVRVVLQVYYRGVKKYIVLQVYYRGVKKYLRGWILCVRVWIIV